MKYYRVIERRLVGLDASGVGSLEQGQQAIPPVIMPASTMILREQWLVSVYRDKHLNIGDDNYKTQNAAYAMAKGRSGYDDDE